MSSAPTFESTAAAVARLGACAADFAQMTDDSLLEASSVIAAHSRTVDAYSAWVAAEISRRSSRDLGHSGLAARQGFKSPVELVQSVSHISRQEAEKLVKVGVSLETSPSSSVSDVGIDVLDAINSGLGRADAAISAARLEQERARLIELSRGLTVEEIRRRARMVRDELDAESVSRREKTQQDMRFWKNTRRTDGMVSGSYLLPPEQGELMTAAFQNVMSPRRSGPRFDDPRKIPGDDRTDEQFAADNLMAMVQLAVDADPGTVFGTYKPAVTVIVREEDLANGTGFGLLQNSKEPVSIETVERIACESGYLGILFDGNLQAIDVGREQRLHNRAQRRAIAARDGGCMADGCDMPVSMTQVHHPNHFHRDNGVTSIENGILLCAFHHMMLHNRRWNITYDGVNYWMIPSSEDDPGQRAILLRSKNPLLQRTG